MASPGTTPFPHRKTHHMAPILLSYSNSIVVKYIRPCYTYCMDFTKIGRIQVVSIGHCTNSVGDGMSTKVMLLCKLNNYYASAVLLEISSRCCMEHTPHGRAI